MQTIPANQLLAGLTLAEPVTIRAVVTDSRKVEPGCVFVCFPGERVDGHDYAAGAYRSGAEYIVANHPVEGVPADRTVIVPDSGKAMIRMASNYRMLFNPRMIGVTGSVGKTTTKEFCYAVLSAFGKTLKTEGNQNNDIGVPNTLFRLTDDTEYAVVEMGMDHAGEIERLTRCARPSAGIITMIGVSHLENLGTRENILKAKLEICTGLPDGAPLALNADNDLLPTASIPSRLRPVWFGIDAANADVRAVDVVTGANGTTFKIIDTQYGTFDAAIPTAGIHTVYDALAAYAAATLKKGHWNVVAGLRGEYTRTTGYGSDVRQRYFSLFPNANLTYAFDAAGLWSLTAQYARNISRPGFWALNPMRMQISDYTYQSGNPDLLPAYTDNLSLTAVFAGKYSLSAGAQLHHDEIAQVFGSDAADASITNLRFENLDRTEQYFAAANIPLQLTKWWTLNANLTGICRRDRITADAPLRTTWAAFANAATTFTLPRKFFIEAEYYAMSRFRQANLDMKSYHSVTLSLKKRLLDNRLTLTAQVANLFDRSQRFVAETETFVRDLRVSNDWQPRRFVLTVNYNFKTGKSFKARKVESGAGDEKGRM